MDENYTGDNLMSEQMIVRQKDTYQMVVLRDVVVFPGQSYTVDVGRDKSILALNRALQLDRNLFVVTQKHRSATNPAPQDIYRVGTVVRVKQVMKTNGELVRAVLEGIERKEIDGYVTILPFYEVTLKDFEEKPSDEIMLKAVRRNISEQLDEYKKLDGKGMLDLQLVSMEGDVERFIAVAAKVFFSDYRQKQELLSLDSDYRGMRSEGRRKKDHGKSPHEYR